MVKGKTEKAQEEPKQTSLVDAPDKQLEPDAIAAQAAADAAEQLGIVNSLQAELDDARKKVEELEARLSSGDSDDNIAMAVPFIYNEDPKALKLASGRCEVNLIAVKDMYRMHSLTKSLRDRKARYIDGRGTERLVDRPAHVILWLLQSVQFEQDVVFVIIDDESGDDDGE